MQPTARKTPDAYGIRGFTLAAEKYFSPGGAGGKMDWNLFQRLRALEVCDAFFLAWAGGEASFFCGEWGWGALFVRCFFHKMILFWG